MNPSYWVKTQLYVKLWKAYGDAITLEAELVEIQTKPSKPIGTTGRNAFGEEVFIEDKGIMRRGILGIGRQDTNSDGLEFVNNSSENI